MASMLAFGSSTSAIAGTAWDPKFMVMALAAVACVLMPFDVAQLTFAVCGAITYYLLAHAGFLPTPQRKDAKGKAEGAREASSPASKGHPGQQLRRRAAAPSSEPHAPRSRPSASDSTPARRAPTPALAVAPKAPTPSPSVQPVAAPKFEASCFDDQVTELLVQITPNAETEQVVADIAKAVQQKVRKIIPEAEVVGVASGNVHGRSAFGVAVPDVDIVAHVSPDVLMRRLELQAPGGRITSAKEKQEAARRWQKSAIRACTDCLVASGSFKFRRSAFRGPEPKVTLLVPPTSGLCTEAVPVDLSVNTATPLHSVALLAECGHMEPRAKDLILLVRRWARDRGICHASKGHLPPYAWTLLVIYYLQVGEDHQGPMLPPLDQFTKSSSLLGSGSAPVTSWTPPAAEGPPLSVGALFAGFVGFLNSTVDWKKEAADVRYGRRAPPDAAADVNIVIRQDGGAVAGPTIPDPFDARRNVAAGVSDLGLVRLGEELVRAVECCARAAPLAELLEPWRPNWDDAEAPEAS